jgi:hypothetical protein
MVNKTLRKIGLSTSIDSVPAGAQQLRLVPLPSGKFYAMLRVNVPVLTHFPFETTVATKGFGVP